LVIVDVVSMFLQLVGVSTAAARAIAVDIDEMIDRPGVMLLRRLGQDIANAEGLINQTLAVFKFFLVFGKPLPSDNG